MRWKGREKSQNIEDRRGMSRGKIALEGSLPNNEKTPL